MIQKLILDCFGFSKPRNDDRGEGRETWVCSAPGAFPSLAMTIKGRGKKRTVRRGKGRREKKSCGRCGNLREGEKKEQRQGQAFKGGEKGVWPAVEGKKKRAATGGEADDT